jgi:hypothetical protein
MSIRWHETTQSLVNHLAASGAYSTEITIVLIHRIGRAAPWRYAPANSNRWAASSSSRGKLVPVPSSVCFLASNAIAPPAPTDLPLLVRPLAPMHLRSVRKANESEDRGWSRELRRSPSASGDGRLRKKHNAIPVVDHMKPTVDPE